MSTRVTESVWDYPRPPRVARDDRAVRIEHAGIVVADTTSAIRVLETSHPPAFYVPMDDIARGVLEPSSRRTFCEFKGTASYFNVIVNGRRLRDAAWTYESPSPGYEDITDHVSFYPERFDNCTVDGEVVRAQDGDFYGGWVTSEIEGPFKGGPDTVGW